MKSKALIVGILALFAASVSAYWPTADRPSPLRLGLDLQGGSELIYELDGVPAEERARAVHDAKPIIEDRIARGASADARLAAFEVRTDGERLVVTLPGIDPVRLASVKRTIEEQGTLEFRFVITDRDKKADDDEIYRIESERRRRGEPPLHDCHWYPVFGREGREEWLLVEDAPQPSLEKPLNGAYLDPAGTFASQDLAGRRGYVVFFRWNPEGAAMFSEITGPNAATGPDAEDGRRLAIILNETRGPDGRIRLRADGTPFGILYSAPEIESRIEDRGEITGSFTKEEVDRLVTVLRSGSLPGRPHLVDETSIGPLLGDDTIRKGVAAALGGLLLVFAFVAVYYTACGWVTVFALLMNASLILAAMALFGQTLTLPGIAGVILTVGMAVDANVLIFERIREELAAGKGAASAMEHGFSRALSAILDSNITTIITSMILWKFGAGPVEGFGVTLTYGLLFSLFTSVYVTRVFLRAAVEAGLIRSFRMLQLVPSTRIAFSRFFRAGLVVSAVAIVAGLAAVWTRGERYLGIDFTGGVHVRVRLATPMPTEAFRGVVSRVRSEKNLAHADPLVIPYGAAEGGAFREFGITAPREAGQADAQAALASWTAALREALGEDLAPAPFPEEAERTVPRRVTLTALFRPGTEADAVREALRGAFPSVEVSPVEGFAGHAAFAITSGTGTADDIARAVRAGPLRDRFVSNRLHRLDEAGSGGRALYRATFRAPVDSGELQGKLVEKGYAGAMVSPDPDGDAARVVVEVDTDDLTRLESDLSSLHAMGDIFPARGEEPAGREATVRLLFPLTEADLRARLSAVHPEMRLVATAPEGGVMRVSVYAPESALGALARARAAARIDLPTVLADAFRKEISDPFPLVTVRGAAVAAQTKQRAVLASILSLAAIIVYVGFRFDFRSGVAAVAALAHDALIALGALAVAGYSIDLEVVGALLTIIGYSINDTIVIYDRLRENLRARGRGADLVAMMDLSLNQTLSRTFLTTGLTLLAAMSILIWGGDEVRPFAFTLVAGMISGTYSTVYIACPLLARWQAGVREAAKRE